MKDIEARIFFGKNFKKSRTNNKLSQSQLAEQLNTSQSIIAKYERGGKESININELFILKNKLGVDLNSLITGDSEMKASIKGSKNTLQIFEGNPIASKQIIEAMKKTIETQENLIKLLMDQIQDLKSR